MRTNKNENVYVAKKNFIFIFNVKNVHIKFNIANLSVVTFNMTDFKPIKYCIFWHDIGKKETTENLKLNFYFLCFTWKLNVIFKSIFFSGYKIHIFIKNLS